MRNRLVSGGEPATIADPADLRRRRAGRLLWLCPLLSLIFAVALLWLAGLTLWTAVVAGVLVGCPVAVVFALVAERLGKREGA